MFPKQLRPIDPVRLVYLVPALLVILSLACSLPSFSLENLTPEREAAELGPTSGPSFQPAAPSSGRQNLLTLPPALVESDPRPGSVIALDQPITLYFNQPMDRSSVEGALAGQPMLSGRFTWENDSVLTFIPDSPFLPDTEILLTIASTAKSQKGLALLNPIDLRYRTAGYLRLTQVLPAPGARDVDPSSAVVAVFNRPVVPLDADSARNSGGRNLSPLLSITSSSGAEPQGRGEWLNTSTYIFYPEPALAGGESYSVRVDPSVTGVDGAPLDPQPTESSAPLEWSFTTAYPQVVSIAPGPGAQFVPLDQAIRLTFNQVMDRESVEAGFELIDPAGQPVQGIFAWSEDGREVSFQPDELLSRGGTYGVYLSGLAAALGGTPLGTDVRQVFTTVPALAVTGVSPAEGGLVSYYGPVEISISSLLPEEEDFLEHLTITPGIPDLGTYFDPGERILRIYGTFQPETDYNLTVSGNLADRWGDTLGEDYSLNFRTSSLEPTLALTVPSDVLFLTPQDASFSVQAASIGEVTLSVGSVPFEDFVVMLGPDGYNIRQTYQPADVRTWVQTLNAPTDRVSSLELFVSPDGSPLSPGVYYLRIDRPGGTDFDLPYLLVVSNVQATFKLSPSDALVWAVNTRTGEALEGLPVSIYNESGGLLADGRTDAQGLFRAEVEPDPDPYRSRYVLVGSPGEEAFGLAVSTWTYGIEPGTFGLSEDFTPPGRRMYIYTDRPVYRPGQTVYFRAVVRDERNGRYSLPDAGSIPLVLYDGNGEDLARFELSLSAFGTGHGEYRIPEEAEPGTYRLGEAHPNAVTFQVADYRKPEIDLRVSFREEEVQAGGTVSAIVEARYFFDAPASNAQVAWTLYRTPESFELPGYTTGLAAFDLAEAHVPGLGGGLGSPAGSGKGQTGPDGFLRLELPIGSDEDLPQRYRYTLEATVTDESGFPVSARDSVLVNPSPHYIGIRPASWMGTAGEPIYFEAAAVTPDLLGVSGLDLQAVFRKVRWVREDTGQMFGWPRFTPQYTLTGSTDFITGADGRAGLSFTPPEPGTYELRVSGGGAASSVIVWIGGAGTVAWPEPPNSKLALTPDREAYRGGDTASVYIPNPFGGTAQALVTVERGLIMRSEVVEVSGSGLNYALPLSEEDAPNVYLGVTLLGFSPDGRLDFRQGYAELEVAPEEQELHVELVRQPERAGPGDELSLRLRVTDSAGAPVEGEFSIAVIDLAALALAEPNAPGILTAFYGKQPLRVRTALDLAAHPDRFMYSLGGMGGGGEAAPQVAREDFPDTAYWNAALVTDSNGEGSISVRLPDSLTTWKIDVRGLSADTRVGEAESQVVTTQDLLVRPVVPRFFVAGDRVLLAAVVQNNTGSDLEATVSLQAGGVSLEEEAGAGRPVRLPAGGRVRVEWWGTVQDVESASLTFSAVAGELQDSARPAGGTIPVLGYTAPQSFVTSGVLQGGVGGDGGDLERLELVSMPRSFDPRGGELRVELSPSLGAVIVDALEALEHAPYETTEKTISTFLANLETYRVLSQIGVSVPELGSDLERTLREGISRLSLRQNEDGGWGWWSKSESDRYVTSYVLYGLARARGAGIQFDYRMIENAAVYLSQGMLPPAETEGREALNRLSLAYFALSEAGYIDPSLPPQLYAYRTQLDPWAQAFLALTLQKRSPGNEMVLTLLSDLQAGAILTGAGVHWQETGSERRIHSPVTTSSIVLYALAQLQPASDLVPGALRYITAHRGQRGDWGSTYETAWSILAALEVMKGTGEWGGSYAFQAEINETPLASGAAEGAGAAPPVTASIPADRLHPDDPNALVIRRDPGPGNLYYTAYLEVYQPVELAGAVNQGIAVSRSYVRPRVCPDGDCPSLSGASVGETLQVRVSLVLPEDAYNLVVEDYIPAGAQVLDRSLKTSVQGDYNPAAPLSSGWGWWYFQGPDIYDDHLTWAADYLPAGTYVLTYELAILQPGLYHVLPARAWQFYFPEVNGSSAGLVFEIE